MAFKPPKKQSQFAHLKQTLSTADPDNALYQTIQALIEKLTVFQLAHDQEIAELKKLVANGNGKADTKLDDTTYLTVEDETQGFKKSVVLLPGDNVTFDDSIPNERTINASVEGGGAGDHASTHYTAGSDPVTVTNLAGFPSNSSEFLRGDRTFAVPPVNTGPAGPQGPIGIQGIQGPEGDQGIQGPIGPTGNTGPQGSIGPIGPEGPAGIDGAVGATGPQGIPGVKGDTGDTGATGSTGPQGIQGEVGPIGPSGIDGADGATGPQGIQGIPGPVGPEGPIGPEGPAGTGIAIQGSVASEGNLPSTGNTEGDAWITEDTGHLWVWDGTQWVDAGLIQGATGPQGPQGIQGVPGPEGPQGITGSTGPTGPQGDVGPIGPQGTQGIQGVKGDTGDTGPAGAQGIQGIQGVKGDTGATGSTGATGPSGPQGETGATGPQGDTGAIGAQGIQGIQGETGPSGPQGNTGPQGPQGESGTATLPTDALGKVLISQGVGTPSIYSPDPAVTSISLGAIPASLGEVRLPNEGRIIARNEADDDDIRVILIDDQNNIIVGDLNPSIAPLLAAVNYSFIQPDANPLPSPWQAIVGGFKNLSNQATPISFGGTQAVRWDPSVNTFGSNQFAKIKIGPSSTPGGYQLVVGIRMSGTSLANFQGYVVYFGAAFGGAVVIGMILEGAFSVLKTLTGLTLAVGDWIEIQGNSSVLSAYKNDAFVDSVLAPLVFSGQPGFSGAYTGHDNIDAFAGGDLGAEAVVTRVYIDSSGPITIRPAGGSDNYIFDNEGIHPSVDAVTDLGMDDLRWRDGYFSRVIESARNIINGALQQQHPSGTPDQRQWQISPASTGQLNIFPTDDLGGVTVTSMTLNRNGAITIPGPLTVPGGLATTPLNANNLTSGTVPSGRLPADIVTNPSTTGAGNLAKFGAGGGRTLTDSFKNADLLISVTGTTPPTGNTGIVTMFSGDSPVTITNSGVLATNIAQKNQANVFTKAYAAGAHPISIQSALPVISLIETGASADAKMWRVYANAGIFVVDAPNDAESIAAGQIKFSRDGTIATTAGIKERNRTVPMGELIDIPFNAANFTTPTAGATFVVTGANYYYTLIGNMICLSLVLGGGQATITGAPVRLHITLPIAANRQVGVPFSYYASSHGTGICFTSGTVLDLLRDVTGLTYPAGAISLAIQIMYSIA